MIKVLDHLFEYTYLSRCILSITALLFVLFKLFSVIRNTQMIMIIIIIDNIRRMNWIFKFRLIFFFSILSTFPITSNPSVYTKQDLSLPCIFLTYTTDKMMGSIKYIIIKQKATTQSMTYGDCCHKWQVYTNLDSSELET